MPFENLSEFALKVILFVLVILITIPPLLGNILKRDDKKKITGLGLNGVIFIVLISITLYFGYIKEVVSEHQRRIDKTEADSMVANLITKDSTQLIKVRERLIDTLGEAKQSC